MKQSKKMSEIKLYVFGGGDLSVGIPYIEAEIIIKDNIEDKRTKDEINHLKKSIAGFYGVKLSDVKTELEILNNSIAKDKNYIDMLRYDKPKSFLSIGIKQIKKRIKKHQKKIKALKEVYEV